jgi:hypothetical protein
MPQTKEPKAVFRVWLTEEMIVEMEIFVAVEVDMEGAETRNCCPLKSNVVLDYCLGRLGHGRTHNNKANWELV